MPVIKEELAKDLATPEYRDFTKAELAKQGLDVLDKTAKDTLLENHKKEVIEKEIPAEIEKVHSKYDQDLVTIFPGYKRNANEKTYDAMKRVGKETLDTLNNTIADLNTKIKSGDPTGALKKTLEETEQRAKTEIEKRDKEIEVLKGNGEKAVKSVKFADVYSGVKAQFSNQLPAMFKQLEESVNQKILATAVLKDGVLYDGNEDGTIKKDSAFKEITVEARLRDEYKDVIDTRKKQGGTGSQGAADKKVDTSGINAETYVRPETVKTQNDLMTHLLEIGLIRGSKVFNEIYGKHRKDLPLQ